MENHGENSQTEAVLTELSLARQGQKFLGLVTEHFPIELMSKDILQSLIEDKTGRIRQLLTTAFVPQVQVFDNLSLQEKIADQEKFWREVFGLKADFSKTFIPNNVDTNLNFLQLMPQGLTYQQVHDKEKTMYSKYWDYKDNWPDNIDMEFEERKTDKNYAFWHSGNAEADEIYKNKSADWILKKKIKTMTRLEGAVFGLYMLWKHKIIIDKKVISLWSGSRYSDGRVPYSYWNSVYNKFYSYCYSSGSANGGLRPRPVVS